MTTPLSIGQLVGRIKDLLEDSASLHDVLLQGEVSNFTRDCVMWRGDAQRLDQLPQNGQQVLAHGYVSLYESQGKLQFYVDWLQAAGVGQLYLKFEELKARLAAEGLFDPMRKRALPAWPQRIGVVTSPRAAALRDILRTLAARYPAVDVLLAPAAVQGIEAPSQLVTAIELLNVWHLGVEPIDLILVARGGGSIEELWAFNDERVARAIAASAVPVISGVGHETDVTLADFAADLRASTPTAAATLSTPDRAELAVAVQDAATRLAEALARQLAAERRHLAHTRRLLQRLSPAAQIAARRQQVDELSLRRERQMRHRLALQRLALDGLRGRLLSLDPRAVLQRGYAIVYRAADGQVLTSTQQVAAGDPLRIALADGEFNATVNGER